MSLRKRLGSMVVGLPSGSSVMVPVDWLRRQLEAEPDRDSLDRLLTLEQASGIVGRAPSTGPDVVQDRSDPRGIQAQPKGLENPRGCYATVPGRPEDHQRRHAPKGRRGGGLGVVARREKERGSVSRPLRDGKHAGNGRSAALGSTPNAESRCGSMADGGLLGRRSQRSPRLGWVPVVMPRLLDPSRDRAGQRHGSAGRPRQPHGSLEMDLHDPRTSPSLCRR